jgi:cell division protein FtsL
MILIKSIALATVQELDVQNDNINKLTSTVDSANQRIQEHDKRIKQLT